jgi:hypothetical protein
MATSILDPFAFIRACSAPIDKLGFRAVSIATDPNRAVKLVGETASARGARILVTGTAADGVARSVRCKTLAATSVSATEPTTCNNIRQYRLYNAGPAATA